MYLALMFDKEISMNYYTDITILPDAEFSKNTLMVALYSKLHKALCELNSQSIGVSFPKGGKILGDILRIHSDESSLQALLARNWIGAMSSYCHVTSIRLIPESAKFRNISRKQPTMSEAKLRRLVARGSIPEKDIPLYREKMLSKRMNAPFLLLKSNSTGHMQRRYFVFGDILDKPVDGVFDQFGLSKLATIPWF